MIQKTRFACLILAVLACLNSHAQTISQLYPPDSVVEGIILPSPFKDGISNSCINNPLIDSMHKVDTEIENLQTTVLRFIKAVEELREKTELLENILYHDKQGTKKVH